MIIDPALVKLVKKNFVKVIKIADGVTAVHLSVKCPGSGEQSFEVGRTDMSGEAQSSEWADWLSERLAIALSKVVLISASEYLKKSDADDT